MNPFYDPETMTCQLERESYVYVDLNANKMYDPEIDGEIFNYEFLRFEDEIGDLCCQKAADEDDFASAKAICDRCEEDDTQDEYFIYN